MVRQMSLAALATVTALTAIALSTAALAADEPIYSVMGSINIEPGRHAGSISNVNGSIHIGADAVVGSVTTVNGSLTADAHATCAMMVTVNGSIHVGSGAHVTGTVSTVNGSIALDSGADVAGSVASVNGTIRTAAAHVGGGISTVNGNLDIGADSRIEGGLHMLPNNGGWFSFFSFWQSTPHVVIGPGANVSGTLLFEQEVKLYVSDRATIGPVKGAAVIKFSGPRPPD